MSAVSIPPVEQDGVQELNRMLQLGTATLVGPHEEKLVLPDSVYDLLKDAVRHMAAGRAVTLVPQRQHLTTQRAANMLGFSRPYLIKLLESGVIPYEKVGQHRRVLLKDLLAFEKRRDHDRKKALNRLAQEEFESGSYVGTEIPVGGSDV